jgi:hypothetical protein
MGRPGRLTSASTPIARVEVALSQLRKRSFSFDQHGPQCWSDFGASPAALAKPERGFAEIHFSALRPEAQGIRGYETPPPQSQRLSRRQDTFSPDSAVARSQRSRRFGPGR